MLGQVSTSRPHVSMGGGITIPHKRRIEKAKANPGCMCFYGEQTNANTYNDNHKDKDKNRWKEKYTMTKQTQIKRQKNEQKDNYNYKER